MQEARWPLQDHRLEPLVGLGVSNQILEPPVAVSVQSGVITIVVPGVS